MNYVQPIRTIDQLNAMKTELRSHRTRDFLLFLFGINTGLRVSDIIELTVGQVKFKEKVTIKEKKTSKSKTVRIFNELYTLLNEYITNKPDTEYIFKSNKGNNQHISRVQAYKILSDAAKKLEIEHIGTHSMRKTFGYYHYKQYKDVAFLQNMFNHSTPTITLRYIGISDDEIDDNLRNFSL